MQERLSAEMLPAPEKRSVLHRADQLLDAITSKNAVTFQENVHEAW